MIPQLPQRRFQVLSLAPESETSIPQADSGMTPRSIHLWRPGMSSGPYSPEEIKEALARDQISAADLAWHKGLVEWAPLSTMLNADRDLTQATNKTNNSDAAVFYDRLSTQLLTSATELFGLLEEVESAPAPQTGLNKLETFLEAFPYRANQFIAHCSSMIAADVRHATSIEAIRCTPGERLTIELREAVFKDLDAALRPWYVSLDRTFVHGEQVFNRFLVALRELPAPLISYASTKCFGATADTQKQVAYTRDCSAQCDGLIERMVQKFSLVFGGYDSEERRIGQLVQMQQRQLTRMKAGCAVAPILIAALVAVLVKTGGELNEFTGTVVCVSILILLFVCCSNLLKLVGLWL